MPVTPPKASALFAPGFRGSCPVPPWRRSAHAEAVDDEQRRVDRHRRDDREDARRDRGRAAGAGEVADPAPVAVTAGRLAISSLSGPENCQGVALADEALADGEHAGSERRIGVCIVISIGVQFESKRRRSAPSPASPHATSSAVAGSGTIVERERGEGRRASRARRGRTMVGDTSWSTPAPPAVRLSKPVPITVDGEPLRAPITVTMPSWYGLALTVPMMRPASPEADRAGAEGAADPDDRERNGRLVVRGRAGTVAVPRDQVRAQR